MTLFFRIKLLDKYKILIDFDNLMLLLIFKIP